MFNYQEQRQKERYILSYFALLLIFLVLTSSLVFKTVIAHKYYSVLSEANRVREELNIAPRGVFFDTNGQALTANDNNPKHGFIRRVLYPEATAHLLGYLALPDQVSLQDYSCGAPPLSNQFIGKTGLEKFFECQLRGKSGKTIYETDALGKKSRELARIDPIQGRNINLTVSLPLQKAANDAFGSALTGGVIASDPKTGAVLLYYSSPGFNSNLLLSKVGLYHELETNMQKPLFDRLALGLYPPGSVIKPILALGALEKGIISKETTFEDQGTLKLGGVEFGNWYYLQYGKTEGKVDVIKAIKRSNDIYFYQLGIKMGVNNIDSWLKKFGFHERSLAQYFPQSQSLLPDQVWKKKTLGENWYLGDTVNLAIGQGYLLVNPIQMHMAIAILANQGKKCELYFSKNGLRHCQNLGLNQEHLNTVVSGMVQACAPGGTGWPLFDYTVNKKRVVTACKTGTAEAADNKALPHAWFTVMAPIPDPKIVLTVLVEHGGEGSEVAAPIAKQILDTFFATEMTH